MFDKGTIMSAVADAAQEMREHGHTNNLVALVGEGIELKDSKIITDYGVIPVRYHPSVAPETVVTMTESAYLEMLEREGRGE